MKSVMSAIGSPARRLVSMVAILVGGLGIGLSPACADANRPTAAPAPAASTPPASPATLPNGATSLTEVYGDWTVSCSIQSNAKHCGAKQEQINQQSRQLVLAIELDPVDDRIEGVALLPFGLALESGVALQIDEQPAMAPTRFRTCLPTGCVAPLTFDARTVASLRTGTALKAKVVVDGGGGETVLAISLKGFTAAIDRTAVLAQPERNMALKK